VLTAAGWPRPPHKFSSCNTARLLGEGNSQSGGQWGRQREASCHTIATVAQRLFEAPGPQCAAVRRVHSLYRAFSRCSSRQTPGIVGVLGKGLIEASTLPHPVAGAWQLLPPGSNSRRAIVVLRKCDWGRANCWSGQWYGSARLTIVSQGAGMALFGWKCVLHGRL
jgi:hypothetical protein